MHLNILPQEKLLHSNILPKLYIYKYILSVIFFLDETRSWNIFYKSIRYVQERCEEIYPGTKM